MKRTLILPSLILILLLPSAASAMLHPVQNRFVQRDPTGYPDGMNRYEWEGSGPIVRLDPDGMKWHVKRSGQATAHACNDAASDKVDELVEIVRLDAGEFQKWLSTHNDGVVSVDGRAYADGTKFYPKSSNAGVGAPGCYFKVPNRVLAYWAGEFSRFIDTGKLAVGWYDGLKWLGKKGAGFLVDDERDWTAAKFNQYIQDKTKSKELQGIFFWGHGFQHEEKDPRDPRKVITSPGGLLMSSYKMKDQAYYSLYSQWREEYKMGLGILAACFTNDARGHFSRDAVFWGWTGVYVPMIRDPIPNVRDIIRGAGLAK